MADLPPTDPEVAIRELKDRIAELESELAAERGKNTAADGELTGLRAQLAALTAPPTPKAKRRVMAFSKSTTTGK
jgi:hypothetical protein